MANTGFQWDAAWTLLDAAIVLTQGGVTTDLSAQIDCTGYASILVSVDSDYSNHAKATGGLFIYMCKEVNDVPVFEDEADNPWGFEMPFAQNDTRRHVFELSVSGVDKVKLLQDWDNSTGGSNVTTATYYKFSSIPPAS